MVYVLPINHEMWNKSLVTLGNGWIKVKVKTEGHKHIYITQAKHWYYNIPVIIEENSKYFIWYSGHNVAPTISMMDIQKDEQMANPENSCPVNQQTHSA